MDKAYYLELYKELLAGIENRDFDELSSIPSKYRYEHLLAMFELRDYTEDISSVYNPLWKTAVSCGQANIQNKVENGIRVRVVFIIDSISKLRCSGLYDRLSSDVRFEASVLLYASETNGKDVKRTADLLQNNGYNFIEFDYSGKSIDSYWDSLGGYPDIAIYTTSRISSVPTELQYVKMPFSTLNIYVPGEMDGIDGYGTDKNSAYNSGLINAVWKAFSYNLFAFEKYKTDQLLKGENVIFSGCPDMDHFYEEHSYEDDDVRRIWKIPGDTDIEKCRRIIISPSGLTGMYNGYEQSTFRQNAFFFLYYAKKHVKDASFIFMPRSELADTVKFTEFFIDNNEFEKYLNEWNDLPNAKVIIDEPYIDVFSTSDAMITDSVSLTGEYIYTLKPVLFLTGSSQRHDKLAEHLINSQFACPGDDYVAIEDMISDVILSGNDDKIEDRIELFAAAFDYVGYNEAMATDCVFNMIDSLVKGT